MHTIEDSAKKAKSDQAEWEEKNEEFTLNLPEDYKSSTCYEDRFSGRTSESRLFSSNLHT